MKTEMFNIGNLNHIYSFCLLWSSIFVMMQKWDASYEYGLKKLKNIKLNRCVIIIETTKNKNKKTKKTTKQK